MCDLYSITTNQAAIIALFRAVNRYVGNLPPMPGVFPDYPAPVIRNTETGRELIMMRWGMPVQPQTLQLFARVRSNYFGSREKPYQSSRLQRQSEISKNPSVLRGARLCVGRGRLRGSDYSQGDF
jgi:putative SOS response-associated peptidase YedK